MVKYLLSNFSSNMVDKTIRKKYISHHTELTEKEFNELKAGAVAVVRNPAFARLLNVPFCRTFIQLQDKDTVIVVGTNGGKLDYHATSLPPELSLTFEKVTIEAVV